VRTTRNRLFWLGLGLAALAALLAPRLLPTILSAGRSAETPTEESEETLEVEVRLLAPQRLEERLATTGTVQAEERVEIRPEISGTLEKILFEEGARVERGQLLVKIDDEQLTAERDRAHHRLELARMREARESDLLDQGLISQDDYDRTRSELNVLEAELRLTEAQLEKTRIRAPFRGLIGLRRVSEGAALTPQTRIVTLQALDTVKIDFSVPERYAGRIRAGDTVDFRVEGLEETFVGEIYAVEPAVDPNTRSLMARAQTANPDGVLLPGAFADIEVVVHEIEDALAVPATAIIPELGGKKVFVVEEGRAQPRPVETGIRAESEVQILRGLVPGDRVIVTGVQRLSTGLVVNERPESSS
jgi:membrane fusion protein (multidrug efflux system)